MHETKIHPPFEGIHIASLTIEGGGSVRVIPQINSPRRIIVQEGHGSIILTDLNTGGVCRPGEIIDIPYGAHVQITNLLENDYFSLTVVQKTSLDEELFKVM